MSWFITFLTSSAGKKVLMSLTGLFLCTFLVVHMAGNMQLLLPDGGQTFNEYTKQMTTSRFIQIVGIFTYATIILHAIQGILIALKNRKSRSVAYAHKMGGKGSSWASRNMALLGTIIFVFIIVHMQSFWYKMKFGEIPMRDGYKDMYSIVETAFSSPLYVAFYLISLVALAYHLIHGFQSAFQTLGIRHSKYTPIIKFVGYAFSILIPLGFASQPIVLFIKSLS